MSDTAVIKKTGTWTGKSSQDIMTETMDHWYQSYKSGSKEEPPRKTLDHDWFVEKWQNASGSEKKALKKMAMEVFGESNKTDKDGVESLDQKIDRWIYGHDDDPDTTATEVTHNKLSDWYKKSMSGNAYDPGVTRQTGTNVTAWCRKTAKSIKSDEEAQRFRELCVTYLGYSPKAIERTYKSWMEKKWSFF